MRTKRTIITAGAVMATAALLVGCSAPANGGNGSEGAESVDLQLATYLGPTAPPAIAIQWAADELNARSDGEINVEIFFAGSLLEATDILTGVAQNRADMGLMSPPYNPGELPLTQSSAVPFQNDDAHALSAAWLDLWENNEAFQQEWTNSGVHPLSFIGAPTGIVSAQEPIESIDWFQGKNVRATSYTANALETVGANPVGITLGEIYEGMERGTVDGYASMLMDTITSASLHEVSPYVTSTGIGTYTGNVVMISPTVWDGLSPEHQAVFEEVFSEFPEHYLETYSGVEDEVCEALIEAGGGVNIWDESETQRWEDAVGDSVLNDWRDTVSGAGLDADAFWSDFQAALDANQRDDFESGMERCAAR
jgi:TRAP-type transport system periplasmic protein